MLKGTGLTLWLVSNCAYIVRLSNCPPHLTQVFHAGGRQWWWGVRWGGGALTQRKCRTDTYKNVKDSVPSSLQSVLAWRWIHVKNLQGEKKTEASWRECVITRHGDAGRVIQTLRWRVWRCRSPAGGLQRGRRPIWGVVVPTQGPCFFY